MAHETGGRSTYLGINAQSLAAMSLFLQYLRYSDLERIEFEQPKLKDFNLVFKSKKIICESKSYKLTHTHIKEILDGIDSVDEKDEIVIICKEVSSGFKSDLELYKYFDKIKEKLIEKGFTENHFKLFPHLSFREVGKEDNRKIVESLFAKVLGIWVPEKDFKEIIDSIILRKVYYGSEGGQSLTKKEFLDELEERKKEIQKKSGYYSDKDSKIKNIEGIYQALQDPKNKKDWSPAAISSLTGSPDIHHQTIQILKSKDLITLKEWNDFWLASLAGTLASDVLEIFKKNIKNKDNQIYVVNLLPKVSDKMTDYFRDRFYRVDIAELCELILDLSRDHDEFIFQIIKTLIDPDNKEKLFLSNAQSDEWELEKLSGSLKTLYQKTDKASVKNKVINYILERFNLVEDDGDFWHDTPNEIFDILKDFVHEDPFSRIIELSKQFSKQFQSIYKKNGKKHEFKGWEHSSGSHDRHFITLVLSPCILDSYTESPEKTWKFIVKEFVTKDAKEVSEEHPDFMNRIPLPVIVKEYESGQHKKEAFTILSKLIIMSGIPTKADLIFELVLKSDLLSASDKWELVQTQLKEPKFRGLPFRSTEAVVTSLANKGHKEALEQIQKWSTDPEYNKIRGTIDESVIDNVPKMLDKPETKNDGVVLLKNFLASNNFKNEIGKFKVWDIAGYVSHLLKIDSKEGINILMEIWKTKPLTNNQQTLLTSTIGNIPDNEKGLLQEVYNSVVSFWFDECKNNIKALETIFTDPVDRYSFISFGEKLTHKELIHGAMRIANIFIGDSDPEIDTQDLHEKIKNGEKVQTISTVRGRLCFLLERVSIDDGRKYIPKIISLVKKLTEDPNYYVRSNSCFALGRLMRLRHCLVGDNRFMSMKDANEIEKIAYTMLNNTEDQKIPQIMEGLAQIFGSLKTLSESEVSELFKKVVSINDEVAITDMLQLFLFYAEFRQDAFKNDKRYELVFGKNIFGKLNEYDGNKFNQEFLTFIKSKTFTTKLKSHLAWLLWKLPTESSNKKASTLDIPFRYFPLLIEPYEKEVYNDVYYFIEDNLDKDYKNCAELWKACILNEKVFLTKNLNKDNFQDLFWLPYHRNGGILAKINVNEGQKEFVKWFGVLLDYPDGLLIANDLNEAVAILENLPYSIQTKRLFDNLVNREGKFFDARKEWLKRNNKRI